MIIDLEDEGFEVDDDLDLSNCHIYWYPSFKREYCFVYELKSGEEKVLLHRWVYQLAHGPIQKGFSVHHLDGNTKNNRLSNLELMETKRHLSLHNKGKKLTQEQKDGIAHRTTELFKDPEFRKKFSEKMTEVQARPGAQDKRSATMIAHYEDPEHREKMSKIMKEICNRPEYKAKMSATMKRRNKK